MSAAAKRIGRDASLHEKAVQPVAIHGAPGRARKRTASRKLADVTTMRMDLRVWRKALELADGDRFRIQVISETEVIVHNNDLWRTRRNHR